MGAGAMRRGAEESSTTKPHKGMDGAFTAAYEDNSPLHMVIESPRRIRPLDSGVVAGASFHTSSMHTSFAQFCDQEQLDVEKALTELLDGCSACVTAMTPGEPIVWVNDEFVEMSGFQREEVLGQPCKFLQGEKTTFESRVECRRLIDSRAEGFVSIVNYTKEGKQFDNGLYMRPLYRKGECPFFLGSQLDLRGLMRFSRRVTFCDEPEVVTFPSEREDDPDNAPPKFSFYEFCDEHQLEVETGLMKLLAMPSDPGTLKAMMKDYSRLAKLGQLQQAVEMTQELLEMQMAELGPQHPETLATMSAYGSRLAEMGLLPEAAKIEKELLKVQKKVLGPQHLETLTTMNNFANRLARLGRPREAVDMSLQMLELQKAKLGPRHPQTLITMSNCANRLNEQGRLQDGADMFLEVLEMRKIVLGPRHPNTLRALSSYSYCLQQLGRTEEAAQSRRELRTLKEQL